MNIFFLQYTRRQVRLRSPYKLADASDCVGDSSYCSPVLVNDDPMVYRFLTETYLNWVHDPNCDENYNLSIPIGGEDRNVTFMRDDSVGDPKDPTDQYDNIQEINAPEGTDVFFPVYYFHSSIGEGHCESLKDCVEVAQKDLGKIDTTWAKISRDDGSTWQDITTNLADYNVAFPLNPEDPGDSSITVTVGNNNRLNREPEYHLGPGPHEGAVLGTFMYLRNFKKGKYIFDFGGNASNFSTRSVYTMHVA